jgi:TctA family transporter
MMEMSFRQSLSMSSGSYQIFVSRPIALVLISVGVALLLLNMISLVVKRADWRQRFGFAGAKE